MARGGSINHLFKTAVKHPCFDRATNTDCPNRHAGCAVGCEKWAAYKEEVAKQSHKRFLSYTVDDYIAKSYVRRNNEYAKAKTRGGV